MHAELRQENSTLVALQRLEALDAQRRAEDQARIAQHEHTATILLAARNRNTKLFGLATTSCILLVAAMVTLGWQHQQHTSQVATILEGFSRKRTTLEQEHAAAVAELQQALQAARSQAAVAPAVIPAPAPEIKRPTVSQTVDREKSVPAATTLPSVIKVPTFSRDPLDGLEGMSEAAEIRKPPRHRSRHRRR